MKRLKDLWRALFGPAPAVKKEVRAVKADFDLSPVDGSLLRSVVVVGLGRTGLSCVRYLHARDIKVAVTDSRAEPPGLAQLDDLKRHVDLRFGLFDERLLANAQQVVVSPGVPLDVPFLRAARARGIEIVGDIELFARAADAPVIGVTGTNGKSTVTTLVACMGEACGRRVRAGGNLGKPALELLADPAPDFYVLELSSFQLESTRSLVLEAAAVLNVTADHLDRYDSIEDYAAAKARIFANCEHAVVNLDDQRVSRMPRPGQHTIGFSTLQGARCDYGITRNDAGKLSLARRGEPLLALDEMKLAGIHNAANALAALALGEAVGFELEAMLGVLREFAGLPHRMQWIADINGVRWIDDSKGTNVGATCAAIRGLEGPAIVIAGGEGKGQNFGPLAEAFRGKVRHAVVLGRDAEAVARVASTVCSVERVGTMQQAVAAAASRARSGDTVLLSPACASQDMFLDYAERGKIFAAAVRGLAS